MAYLSLRSMQCSRTLVVMLARCMQTSAIRLRAAGGSTISRSNLILMGCPGSGKTTVGKLVAKRLGLPFVDIDDDLLEPYWGMTVAKKLAQVGSGNFVEEEGKAFLTLHASNSVVSLTGSNPLYAPAMDRARKLGIIVYIDVAIGDILDRLHRMKVNRIVGQETGASMEQILHYRLQFYERYYDYRVICEAGEPPESIADKVSRASSRWKNTAADRFTSTRAKPGSPTKSLLQVTVDGLAADRGLYVRDQTIGCSPMLSSGQWKRLVDCSYSERALRILEQWIAPDQIEPSHLRAMIERAYAPPEFGKLDRGTHTDAVAPLVQLRGNRFLLELFWGPTASFKDFALQLTPQIFDHAVSVMKRSAESTVSSARRYLILVATSGDTGGAVLNGFSRHAAQCDVMVLFPEDGVSSIQKAQMTSVVNDRVSVIGVRGDFDFCQSTIKKIFVDSEFNEALKHDTGFLLSAANSINLARLLPQVVYHASSYLDLVKDGHISFGEPVDAVVPTGNFGNITAAFYAKGMGIPFGKLVCASNTNNVLTDFINKGIYDISNRKLELTASPAIDILKSSNLERYIYAVSDGDAALVQDMFSAIDRTGKYQLPVGSKAFQRMHDDVIAGWCTEEECFREIRDTLQDTGYLLDPHTAVAKVVADRMLRDGRAAILSATAHYSKFADSVGKALGVPLPADYDPVRTIERLQSVQRVAMPAPHHLLKQDVAGVRYHKTVCGADEHEVRQQVRSFAAARRRDLHVDR